LLPSATYLPPSRIPIYKSFVAHWWQMAVKNDKLLFVQEIVEMGKIIGGEW
jgi:hypothetical protein